MRCINSLTSYDTDIILAFVHTTMFMHETSFENYHWTISKNSSAKRRVCFGHRDAAVDWSRYFRYLSTMLIIVGGGAAVRQRYRGHKSDRGNLMIHAARLASSFLSVGELIPLSSPTAVRVISVVFALAANSESVTPASARDGEKKGKGRHPNPISYYFQGDAPLIYGGSVWCFLRA